MNHLKNLIHSKQIIVCCGSGGVGKTTTSAALAIYAAMEGKRVVVITIDPAKRLATSLGLKHLSSTATDITPLIPHPIKGKAWAIMPDTTQTFESFIKSMAGKNVGIAQRILCNSIYKIFTKEFSGTNEYMAMEKLYDLYQEQKYDLIVLDTPPSANTLTFLKAPTMLADFFDDNIMRWLIVPGSHLVASGIKKMMQVLEKLTGHGFISELIEFSTSLFELKTQFMDNLRRVNELLHQDNVAFLVVTTPERLSKNDTKEFVQLLAEKNYPFWGFIVNRVLSKKLGLKTNDTLNIELWASLLKNLQAEELPHLKTSFQQLLHILSHERNTTEFLKNIVNKSHSIFLIQEQPTDVHSVKDLLNLCFEFENP